MSKSSLIYLSALIGFTAFGPPMASAQEPTPAKEDEEIELAPVVVVARKRDESLDEVPVSVSALSAGEQSNLVLDGMGDYIKQTAGALLVSGGPDYLADISIRG